MWYFPKKEVCRMRRKKCIEQELPTRCRTFQHIIFLVSLPHRPCIFVVIPSVYFYTLFFYLIVRKCRSRKCRTSSVQEYIDVSDLHIKCLQLLYICIRIAVSSFAFSIKNLHTNWSQGNLKPRALVLWFKSVSTMNSIFGKEILRFAWFLLRRKPSVFLNLLKSVQFFEDNLI